MKMNFRFGNFKKWLPFACFFIATALTAVFLYVRSDNLSSEDGFYHFRHAALYREEGIGMSDFRWLPYSVIHSAAADLWYGFHVALVPFTAIRDPIVGLRAAGIVVTLTTLILFYAAVVRVGVRWRFLWPFVLLFASPLMVFRLAMARPHVLSVGLGALLFAFVVSGSLAGIFLTSFAMTFMHVSLFWVPILIFMAVAGVRFFRERIIEWRAIAALIGGLIAGWITRPNPLGAGALAYVQIVQLMIEKIKRIPLHFGMELYPLHARDLGAFWGFLTLWLFAGIIAFLLWRRKKHMVLLPVAQTALWASGLLSLLFFIMTLAVAQRSFDFWVVFGVLFMALTFSWVADERSAGAIRWLNSNNRERLTIAGMAIIAGMMMHGLYRHGQYLDAFGWQGARFRGAAEWLRENTKPDAVVFNVSWDYFPELFFWNTHNRYISGMDPIFQYAYSPALYWKAYYLETAITDRVTCAKIHCESEELEDTHAVLTQDFQTSYVFLSKFADQGLYRYLSSDPRFSIRYEDGDAAVIEVK